MPLDDALKQWAKEFRAAARRDNYRAFRQTLRRLGIGDDDGKSMLEATVSLVQACAGYARIDGRDKAFEQFLAMQKYDLAGVKDAQYIFIFDIGKACARVVVQRKDWEIDLADLYGVPWPKYKVVGYHRFWVSHPDWSRFSRRELKRIKDQVTDDLRYDYADDVEISFDDEFAFGDLPAFRPDNDLRFEDYFDHFEEEYKSLESHHVCVWVHDAEQSEGGLSGSAILATLRYSAASRAKTNDASEEPDDKTSRKNSKSVKRQKKAKPKRR